MKYLVVLIAIGVVAVAWKKEPECNREYCSGHGECFETEGPEEFICNCDNEDFSGPRCEAPKNGSLICYRCEGEEDSACHKSPWEMEKETCEEGVHYCEGRHLINENGDMHFARGCNAECHEGCWHPHNQTDNEGNLYKKVCSKCCREPFCNNMSDMSAGAVTPVVGLLTMLANFAFIISTRIL